MPIIELPTLTYSTDPEIIRRNRATLIEFTHQLQKMIRAIQGLHISNQAFCDHSNKKCIYEADNVIRYYECPLCGWTN